MRFHIGMPVVCLTHAPQSFRENGRAYPEKNCVYTVRAIFTDPVWGHELLRLCEVHNPLGDGIEPGFGSSHFRPLVEDRKSVSFTIGADPDSDRWDNRKKRKEKV